MWISSVIWNSLWRNRISYFFQLNASQHVTRADNVGCRNGQTQKGALRVQHLLLEKSLSVPLFPLDPPPSIYPLFWDWRSLCVKLYRGVITAPLEEGGGGVVWAGSWRCSCLNWPISTESEQPGNYTTAQNLFHGKKQTATTGFLHLFTQAERGQFYNTAVSHITGRALLYLHYAGMVQ